MLGLGNAGEEEGWLRCFNRRLEKLCEEDGERGNNFVLWGCLSGVYQAWYTFYAETP